MERNGRGQHAIVLSGNNILLWKKDCGYLFGNVLVIGAPRGKG